MRCLLRKVETLAILVSGLFKLRAPPINTKKGIIYKIDFQIGKGKKRKKKKTLEIELPARERGPDEVVVGEPVVEDRDEGLPLRVFLVHRRLLLLVLLLLCFSPFLDRLRVLLLFLLFLVLWLGFSAPCLLLLHDALLRWSLHLRSLHSASSQCH